MLIKRQLLLIDLGTMENPETMKVNVQLIKDNIHEFFEEVITGV